MRRHPDVRATGKRSRRRALKFRRHPPRNFPFAWKIWTPSNTWFLRPTRVSIPNGVANGSAATAGLTLVTNRPTDRPRYSVCSNRPHLASAAMRSKLPSAKHIEIIYNLQRGVTCISFLSVVHNLLLLLFICIPFFCLQSKQFHSRFTCRLIELKFNVPIATKIENR